MKIDRADVIKMLEPLVQLCNGKIRPALWNCQVFDWRGFAGTDLNSKLKIGECKGDWFLVNAGRLLEILKSFAPGEEVEVQRRAKEVFIQGGRTKFQLPIVDADGYPDFSIEVKEDSSVDVPSAWLIDSFNRISPAIGKNTTNATLTGVILNIGSDEVNLVGCDGRRMSISNIKGEPGRELSCSIPQAVFKLLCSLPLGEKVGLIIDKAALRVQGSNWELRSCLIEGNIPPWKKILSQCGGKTAATWEGQAKDLKNALNQCLLLSGEANRIEWSISGGRLALQGLTEEGGLAQAEADGETKGSIEGIFANGRYLLDGVKGAADTSLISIQVTKPGKPYLVKSDDGAFLAVVMPLT